MSSLLAVLRSSLGKKYVMGLTGLFLCSFLVIHLAGNFLLYVGAGPYNEYAHKLHSNPGLIITAEVILYSGIAIHLFLAYTTWRENSNARGDVGYAKKHTKIYNRALGIQPESMMWFTGSIVLIFMAIHISDFKARTDDVEPYAWAAKVLGDMTRKFIYVVGCIFVGVHVSHGFRSAFQSLGLSHPKYNRLIDRLSILFAIVVALGFASFPIVFSGMHKGTEGAPAEPTKTEKPVFNMPPNGMPQRIEPDQKDWPKPRVRLLSQSGESASLNSAK